MPSRSLLLRKHPKATAVFLCMSQSFSACIAPNSHMQPSLHIVLALLLVKLTFFLCSSILILLVLGHQVVHVALGLSELHLIHALAGVPMKESLAAEHGREVFRDPFEHLLDGGAVARESHGHLEALRGDVADARLDVVRNPFHEVARIL